jgi:hypothetical protein
LLGGDNEDSPDVAHNNVDVLGHWWKLKNKFSAILETIVLWKSIWEHWSFSHN